jgi:DNA-directed RNA polymerase specialized sigma54-like protein
VSLAPRLDIRQSQSLVMTPQLQQAIKLLTLSNLEVEAFIAEEVEKNPLLDASAVREVATPERPERAAPAGADELVAGTAPTEDRGLDGHEPAHLAASAAEHPDQRQPTPPLGNVHQHRVADDEPGHGERQGRDKVEAQVRRMQHVVGQARPAGGHRGDEFLRQPRGDRDDDGAQRRL